MELQIPAGQALCPCCNGTKLGRAFTEQEQKWWPNKTHFDCDNCGAQLMMGKAKGYTSIDPKTGLGCDHQYVSKNVGRCLTAYTCTNLCGLTFLIDSGD